MSSTNTVDYFSSAQLLRFWSKVALTDNQEDCWEWLATKTSRGYGEFLLRSRPKKRIGAHKFAYLLTYGPIPEGLCVLHRCDNRPCVNPYHLFLGTNDDNSKDMIRKGRSATGERNGSYTHPECRTRGERNIHAKLTEDQVKEIRTLRNEGMSYTELCNKFSVEKRQLRRIINGHSWK